MPNLESHKLDTLDLEIGHGKPNTLKLDTLDLGFEDVRPETNLNIVNHEIGHGKPIIIQIVRPISSTWT
jgi:hypothetical protein